MAHREAADEMAALREALGKRLEPAALATELLQMVTDPAPLR